MLNRLEAMDKKAVVGRLNRLAMSIFGQNCKSFLWGNDVSNPGPFIPDSSFWADIDKFSDEKFARLAHQVYGRLAIMLPTFADLVYGKILKDEETTTGEQQESNSESRRSPEPQGNLPFIRNLEIGANSNETVGVPFESQSLNVDFRKPCFVQDKLLLPSKLGGLYVVSLDGLQLLDVRCIQQKFVWIFYDETHSGYLYAICESPQAKNVLKAMIATTFATVAEVEIDNYCQVSVSERYFFLMNDKTLLRLEKSNSPGHLPEGLNGCQVICSLRNGKLTDFFEANDKLYVSRHDQADIIEIDFEGTICRRISSFLNPLKASSICKDEYGHILVCTAESMSAFTISDGRYKSRICSDSGDGWIASKGGWLYKTKGSGHLVRWRYRQLRNQTSQTSQTAD